jgi:hypothetical protein
MSRIETLLRIELEALADTVDFDNQPTGFPTAKQELLDILRGPDSHGIIDGLRGENCSRSKAIRIVETF